MFTWWTIYFILLKGKYGPTTVANTGNDMVSKINYSSCHLELRALQKCCKTWQRQGYENWTHEHDGGRICRCQR